MMTVMDERQFEFEDDGYLVIRKLKRNEDDIGHVLDFDSDLDFTETNI